MTKWVVFAVGLAMLTAAAAAESAGHSLYVLWAVGGLLSLMAGMALMAPEKPKPEDSKP
jgi:hypothetical protein